MWLVFVFVSVCRWNGCGCVGVCGCGAGAPAKRRRHSKARAGCREHTPRGKFRVSDLLTCTRCAARGCGWPFCLRDRISAWPFALTSTKKTQTMGWGPDRQRYCAARFSYLIVFLSQTTHRTELHYARRAYVEVDEYPKHYTGAAGRSKVKLPVRSSPSSPRRTVHAISSSRQPF